MLCLCLALPTSAVSQSAPARDGLDAVRTISGQYGSTTDPALPCEANPHRLAVTDGMLNLVMTWDRPTPDPRGGMMGELVYRIIGIEGTRLTLRMEDEHRAISEGGFVVRTLRQTDGGYCWTRPEWPVMRCEDRQERCDAAAVS